MYGEKFYQLYATSLKYSDGFELLLFVLFVCLPKSLGPFQLFEAHLQSIYYLDTMFQPPGLEVIKLF